MTIDSPFFSDPKTLVMIGGGCLVTGLLVLLISTHLFLTQSSTQTSVEISSESQHATSSAQVAEIWIDVSGAVLKPGLYALPPESRISDAIAKAGGFSDQADALYVSANINLAQKLVDAQKIFIPFKSSTSDQVPSSQSSSTTSQKINLNSASAKDLQELEGVGEVKANKIIEHRPYQSIDQLLEHKILSANQLEKIKNEISL